MRARGAVALVAAAAVSLAGCGLLPEPVAVSDVELLDAILSLRDGSELRATLDLALDESELRAALREEPDARRLLEDELAADGVETDEVLARLRQLDAELERHAVLLATGTDGSARVAAEVDGIVWADLRVATSHEPGSPSIDLQLRVDWGTAARVADRPDLTEQLAAASERLGVALDGAPDLAAVRELAVAFLAGELVAVRGPLDDGLLAGIGPGVSIPAGPDEELDPRTLAATALSFGDRRRDGDDTLVDVHVEVRALADLLLDRAAATPERWGMTFEDVRAARAEVDRLPDRLVEVATLRLDADGVLRQVRFDLLDAALQLEAAAAPDDERVAAVAGIARRLDRSGLFAVVDVVTIGGVETVLGDPGAVATPAEVAEAVRSVLLGGLGLGQLPSTPGG